MDTPIKMPNLIQTGGNMFIQRPPVTDGGNTFKANALVVITSAALVLVATGGVLVYGLTPDQSHLTTDYPPVAFNGQLHWPFSLVDGVLDINVGTVSSGALVVGQANSAKQRSDAVIGVQYGIATATSGAYSGFQVLDPTNTTNLFFEVVAYPDGTNAADYNSRVRVKIVPVCLQN